MKAIGANDGCRASWEVPYQPGELRAVVDGAQDVLTSTDAATVLRLEGDRTQLPADGQAIAQVEVTLLDDLGRIAAAQDEEIFYQIVGDAEILGIENGCPDDLTPYAQRSRRTHDGRAIVYIRAGHMADEITLRAYTRTGLRAAWTLTQG